MGAIVVVTAPRVAQSAAAGSDREQQDERQDDEGPSSAFEIGAADDLSGGGAEPIPFRPGAETPADLERRAA